jgi:diaminopimelate epimerase
VDFVKGHGTQNDFVLLPDADDELVLTEARVRALCDRQRGLGADGVLRVVSTDHVPEFRDSAADWFMDYRNADGSIAEMCGNGVRVFARYLVDNNLAKPGRFEIATRAGLRGVQVHDDRTVTVDMGPARVLGTSAATLAHPAVTLPGVVVDVGNPHLVCPLEPAGPAIEQLDLSTAPGYDPAVFPNGVNVEFVQTLGEHAVRMRVHERGVGETRSCGTGTVATVAATLHRTGRTSGEFTVDIPGGQVQVTVTPGASTLTGPAVLLASGTLDPTWWSDPI